MDENEILLNSDELNDLAEELKKLAVDDIYKDIEVDLKIVQELLGHASLAATQIYTHVSFDRIKDSYSLSHPRANKNSK